MQSKLAWVLVVGVVLGACARTPPAEVYGPYRFEDGRLISVRPSVEDTLRVRQYATGSSWRMHPDGEDQYVSGSGFAEREPVASSMVFDPASGEVSWRDGGVSAIGKRVGTDRWLSVPGRGASLHARLALPEGPGPYPGIVLIHGSGEDPGTEFMYTSDFFVAHGIAVLTYDKRGTGKSTGDFTFDFFTLADDVAAAVGVLGDRPEVDAERIGVSGYSQGGWVGPLAASRCPQIRYVIVNYGMIESPAEEARLETLELARSRGVDARYLPEIDEVTRSAVAVVASGLDDGWEEFLALKRRYRRAPWRRALAGSPVGEMLRYPKGLVRLVGRRRLPSGLRWDYDSATLLQTLQTPSVWLLGGRDSSAPNEQTLVTLSQLRDRGRPIEVVVYPDADHGMLLFDERDGERDYTGYVPGYWRTEVETARRSSGLPARGNAAPTAASASSDLGRQRQ